MKLKFKYGLTSLLIFFLGTGVGKAQTSFTLKSAKASVEGTSSLHEWTSDIGHLDFKGSFLLDGDKIKEIRSAEMKILVEGIKSTKGKIMDEKTYEAFNYKTNPYITFKFISAKIISDATNENVIEAVGTLTMAGVIKSITINTKGKTLANGDIQLSATKKIKMTEYRMEPPTAVFGTIKVGDEVTVIFDLILTRNKIAGL
jgi:polyisoprenoid-binding protein YceI